MSDLSFDFLTDSPSNKQSGAIFVMLSSAIHTKKQGEIHYNNKLGYTSVVLSYFICHIKNNLFYNLITQTG
jgi:hypothetical protein